MEAAVSSPPRTPCVATAGADTVWIGRTRWAAFVTFAVPSLHSALYYPDAPQSLRVGLRAMTSAVTGLLPPGSEKLNR